MDEVIPGILHWRVPHPRIGVEVSSYLLTDTSTVLDPILPEGAGPGWIGHPLQQVILTVRHHLRSAAELGVPILVHRDGLGELQGDGVEVRGFDSGEELVPGVHALPFGRICADDVALKIDRGPGVLAFGDGLINYGELGHPPDRYIGEDPEAVKASILEGLEPLLEEQFDVLLFAHGAPVPSGGRAMLERFLASRR